MPDRSSRQSPTEARCLIRLTSHVWVTVMLFGDICGLHPSGPGTVQAPSLKGSLAWKEVVLVFGLCLSFTWATSLLESFGSALS